MAVVKVVELLAQSPDGWEAATGKRARGVEDDPQHQSVYVENMQAVVENNEITAYRVNVRCRSRSRSNVTR